MKYLMLCMLLALDAGTTFADEDKSADDKQVAEEATSSEAERKQAEDYLKETGAERNDRLDEELASAAETYNEDVESDLDKVICKKVRITGSRRKERVCRTVREIEAEKKATADLMRRLKRSGQTPAQTRGQGR